jgi:U4/U6 small nuclear ribonucleoprotein PRP31
LNEIERGLEKLQEPPLVKAIKSLAPPIDSGRKEFEANQMKSGEVRLFNKEFYLFIYFVFYLKIEDAYQDAICFSTDLIGKSGSGKVRAVQVDSKTTLNI